jgi:hypothetical protein
MKEEDHQTLYYREALMRASQMTALCYLQHI